MRREGQGPFSARPRGRCQVWQERAFSAFPREEEAFHKSLQVLSNFSSLERVTPINVPNGLLGTSQ